MSRSCCMRPRRRVKMAAKSLVLALCLLACERAQPKDIITTTFTQGVEAEPSVWNKHFKAQIKPGQCAALIHVNLVCSDRHAPFAQVWQIAVEDTTVPLIHMSADMRHAEVRRDGGALDPQNGACDSRAVVRMQAVCVPNATLTT